MCIAVPGKILEIKGDMARTDIMGIEQEVCTIFIEEAKVGDTILIHAGYAISKLHKEEAEKTVDIFREFGVINHRQL